MYLKVLVEATETSPAKTLIQTDIGEVQFFQAELTPDEFRRNWDSFYLITGHDPWKKADKDGRASIGCLIFKHNGKSECVLFNDTAFLCNEQGKAVERFRVS